MIATHIPKSFNSKLQTGAILARITTALSPSLVCSQTTNMSREFWAAPLDAANMRTWREAVQNLPEGFEIAPNFPAVIDGKVKQLLMPKEAWASDDYVSVTPVSSAGLMHEVYKRLYSMNLPYRHWMIQPTPAARSNHGEAMLLQGGAVRTLIRGAYHSAPTSEWRGSFVQVRARCEGMNISGGMMAVGFPAITAIGGFVHTLERATGREIPFAIGFNQMKWGASLKSITRMVGKKPVIGIDATEVEANCEVIILLDTAPSAALSDAINRATRLSGGSLFDLRIDSCINSQPEPASYLVDGSALIEKIRQESDLDSLQAALNAYSAGGEWKDGKWCQDGKRHTLNMSGYAYLETPSQKKISRFGYLHAWVEPVFSLVSIGPASESMWWARKSTPSGFFWQGAQVS